MPRTGYAYTLIADAADAYQRFAAATEQVITLDADCTAVVLAAETATVFVTFDDSAASATNGLPIIAGAQPLFLPLGRLSNANRTLRFFSATGIAHLLQLA